MEDFIPYELAVKLRKKGFNPQKQPNYLYYNGELVEVKDHYNISPYEYAPTISQVLMWLRKEKKIFIANNISYFYESYEKPFPTNPKMEPILKGYYYGVWDLDNLNYKNACVEYFESPELAAIAGIEYVIDNLI